jgi:hypothetical protein
MRQHILREATKGHELSLQTWSYGNEQPSLDKLDGNTKP